MKVYIVREIDYDSHVIAGVYKTHQSAIDLKKLIDEENGEESTADVDITEFELRD